MMDFVLNTDVQISLADFSHKKELTELWAEAFGDDEKFITSFLDAYMIPEYNVPVVIADGKIVSVFYLVEFELYSKMKPMGNCVYLFAAATKKEYRRGGCMSKLIKYAAELCKNRGVKAIFLFPQDSPGQTRKAKLFDFYKKLGFKAVYQTKKITIRSSVRKPAGGRDLTEFILRNQEITDTDIFDGLYKSYVDFTAKQTLAPLKDRLFYFKCAASYLDSSDSCDLYDSYDSSESKFAIFERKNSGNIHNENNVEKFCYVFYKKVKNTYYIDDIIFPETLKISEYSQYYDLLADYIIMGLECEECGDSKNEVIIEMNTLPSSFSDSQNTEMAMIMPLSDDIKEIAENLKSPVYLNMFMNI